MLGARITALAKLLGVGLALSALVACAVGGQEGEELTTPPDAPMNGADEASTSTEATPPADEAETADTGDMDGFTATAGTDDSSNDGDGDGAPCDTDAEDSDTDAEDKDEDESDTDETRCTGDTGIEEPGVGHGR